MKIRRINAVVSKEWREIVRDKLFLSLAFLVPPLLMIIFGYGFTFDVENIPFAIVDYDRSELSRDYASRYTHSNYFLFQGYLESEREIEPLLNSNKIKLAIVIPPDFSKSLLKSRPTAVQTLIDGTSPYRAQVTKGYVSAINADFSNRRMLEYLAKQQGVPIEKVSRMITAINLQVRFLYNEAVSGIWSMVPSLNMLLLMLTPPFLTAVSVVREKENGSIYNVYTSTLTSLEFLIGKLIPYVLISMVNCIVIFCQSIFWFQVPFKGSFLFYLVASFGYVTCTTGIGLFVSLIVRSQLAAVVITGIVSMLPVMLFSGLIVPVKSLSAAGQIISHLIPAMYYNEILQGTFLKGQGFNALSLQMCALYFYGFVLLFLSHQVFSKRPAQ